MSGIICVGLGGALGAVLRYGISLLPYKGEFPVLTLVTNVLGAFVIGCIAGMAARKDLPADLLTASGMTVNDLLNLDGDAPTIGFGDIAGK